MTHENSALLAALSYSTVFNYHPEGLTQDIGQPGAVSQKRYDQIWRRIWRKEGSYHYGQSIK